jgi:hypothetical protein
MNSGTVSLGWIFFVVAVPFCFGTVGAFASPESISNTHTVGQADAESLLTVRIEDVVVLQSPSDCAGDPKTVSDEWKLDPQLPACVRGTIRPPGLSRGLYRQPVLSGI